MFKMSSFLNKLIVVLLCACKCEKSLGGIDLMMNVFLFGRWLLSCIGLGCVDLVVRPSSNLTSL
jgi:hypothetical protein